MVNKIKIGVIGVQGAVLEHVISMQKTLDETKTPGEIIILKNSRELEDIDALILPGGESTTISKMLFKSGIYDIVLKRIEENNLPIMGTCAGCVLLAKKISDNEKDIKLIKAMNMQVKRNAFGRQKESFEKMIDISGFSYPYNAVFIRAPVIKKVWGNCKVLAKINNEIIMAKQDKFLALSFHPELADDMRIHKYFLDMII